VNDGEDRSRSGYWKSLAKEDLERAQQFEAQGFHAAQQSASRQASIASLLGARLAHANGEDLPKEWEAALAADDQVALESRRGNTLQADYYRESSLFYALLAVMAD
jgi:hypothetical protein